MGRAVAAANGPDGALAAWALCLAPPCVRWFSIAGDLGRDRTTVAVAAWFGLLVVRRRPRWVIPVALLVAVVIVLVAGDWHGPIFAGFVVWSSALYAVALNVAPALASNPLVPRRQLVGPAVAVLTLANLALLIEVGRPFEPSEWLNRSIFGLYLVSFALAAQALWRPDAAGRLTDWLARRAVPVTSSTERWWPRWQGWCCRATELRGRWWAGEFPSNPGLFESAANDPRSVASPALTVPDPGAGSRLVRGALSYWVPLVVWSVTVATVNLFRRGVLQCADVCGWRHWDSGQYLEIARHGYHYRPGVFILADGTQQPVAWFPGYALLIRAVEPLVGSLEDASVAITIASGLAVAVLFWAWTAQRGIAGRVRVVSLLCLMWFPYNFMLYGAAYSDPLFLALVLGAFVLWEADLPVPAGLVGAAASLVRVNGLALIVGLVVAAFVATRDAAPTTWSTGELQSRRRRLVLGAALSAGGITSFMLWCWVRYGEPFVYFRAHAAIFGSNNFLKADDWLKATFYQDLVHRFGDQPWPIVNLAVGSSLTILTLLTVPMLRRRFGAGYAAFAFAQVAIIWLGFFDFIASGRYLTAVFPIAAVWGAWLAGRPRLRWVPVLGLAGVFLLTAEFTRAIDLGW